MKKMLFVLIVALTSNNACAFEDLKSTPKQLSDERDNNFLDTCQMPGQDVMQDEYSTQEDTNDLDEYDQNISDNVTPPKVSSAEVMVKEMLGALLVRYIAMREVARIYLTELKDIIINWYHAIIKA